jgi:hypothetical protein
MLANIHFTDFYRSNSNPNSKSVFFLYGEIPSFKLIKQK